MNYDGHKVTDLSSLSYQTPVTMANKARDYDIPFPYTPWQRVQQLPEHSSPNPGELQNPSKFDASQILQSNGNANCDRYENLLEKPKEATQDFIVQNNGESETRNGVVYGFESYLAAESSIKTNTNGLTKGLGGNFFDLQSDFVLDSDPLWQNDSEYTNLYPGATLEGLYGLPKQTVKRIHPAHEWNPEQHLTGKRKHQSPVASAAASTGSVSSLESERSHRYPPTDAPERESREEKVPPEKDDEATTEQVRYSFLDNEWEVRSSEPPAASGSAAIEGTAPGADGGLVDNDGFGADRSVDIVSRSSLASVVCVPESQVALPSPVDPGDKSGMVTQSAYFPAGPNDRTSLSDGSLSSDESELLDALLHKMDNGRGKRSRSKIKVPTVTAVPVKTRRLPVHGGREEPSPSNMQKPGIPDSKRAAIEVNGEHLSAVADTTRKRSQSTGMRSNADEFPVGMSKREHSGRSKDTDRATPTPRKSAKIQSEKIVKKQKTNTEKSLEKRTASSIENSVESRVTERKLDGHLENEELLTPDLPSETGPQSIRQFELAANSPSVCPKRPLGEEVKHEPIGDGRGTPSAGKKSRRKRGKKKAKETGWIEVGDKKKNRDETPSVHHSQDELQDAGMKVLKRETVSKGTEDIVMAGKRTKVGESKKPSPGQPQHPNEAAPTCADSVKREEKEIPPSGDGDESDMESLEKKVADLLLIPQTVPPHHEHLGMGAAEVESPHSGQCDTPMEERYTPPPSTDCHQAHSDPGSDAPPIGEHPEGREEPVEGSDLLFDMTRIQDHYARAQRKHPPQKVSDGPPGGASADEQTVDQKSKTKSSQRAKIPDPSHRRPSASQNKTRGTRGTDKTREEWTTVGGTQAAGTEDFKGRTKAVPGRKEPSSKPRDEPLHSADPVGDRGRSGPEKKVKSNATASESPTAKRREAPDKKRDSRSSASESRSKAKDPYSKSPGEPRTKSSGTPRMQEQLPKDKKRTEHDNRSETGEDVKDDASKSSGTRDSRQKHSSNSHSKTNSKNKSQSRNSNADGAKTTPKTTKRSEAFWAEWDVDYWQLLKDFVLISFQLLFIVAMCIIVVSLTTCYDYLRVCGNLLWDFFVLLYKCLPDKCLPASAYPLLRMIKQCVVMVLCLAVLLLYGVWLVLRAVVVCLFRLVKYVIYACLSEGTGGREDNSGAGESERTNNRHHRSGGNGAGDSPTRNAGNPRNFGNHGNRNFGNHGNGDFGSHGNGNFGSHGEGRRTTGGGMAGGESGRGGGRHSGGGGGPFGGGADHRRAGESGDASSTKSSGDPPSASVSAVIQRILMSEQDNPYHVLGISKNGTQEDIKKAYRRLAILVHPDKCNHLEAQNAFQKLQAAHELVCDEETRRLFDQKKAVEAHQEQAFNDFVNNVNLFKNTIGCDKCGNRHPKLQVDRSVWRARYCSSHSIYHPAQQNDVWVESSCMGLMLHCFICEDECIYEVTEWARCQRILAKVPPNGCKVLIHIVSPSPAQRHPSFFDPLFNGFQPPSSSQRGGGDGPDDGRRPRDGRPPGGGGKKKRRGNRR